jgi:hypothetical protein
MSTATVWITFGLAIDQVDFEHLSDFRCGPREAGNVRTMSDSELRDSTRRRLSGETSVSP